MQTLTTPKERRQATPAGSGVLKPLAPPPKTAENGLSERSLENPESAPLHRLTGLTVIAALMIAVAVYGLIDATRRFADHSVFAVAVSLAVPLVLTVSGVALLGRRGWGWWFSCLLLYFIGLQSLLISVLQVAGLDDGGFGAAPLALAVCAIAITYLSRADVIGRIRFSHRTRQALRSPASPATAGFLLGFLAILVQMFGLL